MNNIINVYKPIGITSNDLVQYIKNKLHLKKVGHAGTLDPMASGVMVIGVNNGTKKLSELILDNKEYIAEITFGKSTTTYDITGEVVDVCNSFNISVEQIKEYIDNLIKNGYNQKPPIFSAIKINGKKLYDYARKNEAVSLPERNVKIYSYDILDFNNNILRIKIKVSKGFYVRSFANDIGEQLKCHAFLSSLVRVSSGEFKIEDSIDMNNILTFSNDIINLSKIDKKIDIENLVIGHFDLIHKSHEKLLKQNDVSVLTFLNNPSKQNDFYNFDERIINIKKFNPKNILYIDLQKHNYTKEEFINLLKEKLNIKNIIVGSDFKFGKNAEGTTKDIENVFNLIKINKDELSTSEIKREIEKGNINLANKELSNNIYISGIVCHGRKIGRKIGFPTINIFYKTNVKIKEGSYATKTVVFKNEYSSVTFVKKYIDNIYLIETYIENFSGDLYGKFIQVIFNKFIREPIKINTLDELKKLIQNDLNLSKK